MSVQDKNKIQNLTIQNFTCFENVHFDFSTGINLFIGENGTGKTHILKLLYAMLSNDYSDSFFSRYHERLHKIFKAEINELLRKKSLRTNDGSGAFKIKKNNKNFIFYFGHLIDEEASSDPNFVNLNSISSKEDNEIGRVKIPHSIIDKEDLKELNSNSLFIPCLEMLSLYPGFISAYNKRENNFDETHYDLALALNANPLKNGSLEEAEKLSKIIEKDLNIKVIMENDKFYIVFKNDNNRKVSAPLAAEGIKKLGQMIYLIRNGSLTKETILFWDEPEVNLNPKYIRLVADFLMTLAKSGVQIFVSTHDYQLAHYLSIKAEYPEVTHVSPMQFFSFYKTENGTQIESSNTLANIQNNTLLDEYAALYELESHLFQQTIKQ